MDVVNTREDALAFAWHAARLDPPGWSATFIVKSTLAIVPDGVATPVEEQPPPTGDEPAEGSLRYPSDFVHRKPRTDLVLAGTCHVPGGKPLTTCAVTFRVGGFSKTLAVIGDRAWRGEPRPFTSMPLTYGRAYGGAGCARNPLGRGFVDVDGTRPMPNVEFPGSLITDPNRPAEPAGFAPIPATWPQRLERIGTFGKKWLKERWPWFPEDFNWAHFNAAPADQQIPPPLRGDEEVALTNMHPRHASLKTRLPSMRPRLFLNERVRASAKLREVPLRLDTLSVDADAGTITLVWHGEAAARDDKLSNLLCVFIASETVAEAPKPQAHYEAALEEALTARAAEDDEFEPVEEPDVESPETEEPPEAEEPRDEAPALPKPPAREPTPDELAAERAASIRKMKETLATMGKPMPPGLEALAGVPVPAPVDVNVEEPPDPEEIPPDEPPPMTAEQVAAHEGSFAGRDLSDVTLTDLDLSGRDFREAILQNVTMRRCNLAGADFTGASMAGARFAEVDARRAILSGADLEAASFTGCDLTEAAIAETNLAHARLRGAKLSALQGDGAILDEADLSDADLRGASLAGASLLGARLHRADLTKANLREAALEGAWGRSMRADDADLTGLKAANAVLQEASLARVSAERSTWEGAQLWRAAFAGARLAGSEFSSAYLVESDFTAADLRESFFDEAVLRGARLRRCSLFDASLARADLTGADLSESNLYAAGLIESVREGTKLEGANLKLARMEEP